MIEHTIILIGPMMAGKSTVGKLLSKKLGLQQVILDEVRWDYFDEIGYDKEVGRQLATEEGMAALLAYWKPFEVHAVERVLAENRDCVIDFGAGYTVQDAEHLFGRIRDALIPYQNVFLLLPSEDEERSIEILNRRMVATLKNADVPVEQHDEILDSNDYFVRAPYNRRLAKYVVFTEGKSPIETCEEIIEMAQ